MINSKLLYWSVVVALAGFRFGASTIAASACVSEIAPPKNRGKLVALYQFNIVFRMPDARGISLEELSEKLINEQR